MLTLHIVPVAYFDAQNPAEDYVPADFAREGFIHTTDGAHNMADTANRHYSADPQPYYVLYIDTARLTSPVRYDATPHIYPHIYGPLNRAAIIGQALMPREAEGTFLPPPESPL